MQLCGQPFLKERTSDENTFATHVLQTLTLLGEIAVTSDDSIRGLVAKSLASFYTADPNRAVKEGKMEGGGEGGRVVFCCLKVDIL